MGLGDWEVETRTAGNREQALEAAAHWGQQGSPCDIALVEADLGGSQDGIETCFRLWRRSEDIQVALLSRNPDSDFGTTSPLSGAIGHWLGLKMPVNSGELHQAAQALALNWLTRQRSGGRQPHHAVGCGASKAIAGHEQADLDTMQFRDPLTGLPSRRSFQDRACQAFADPSGSWGIALFNLDRFRALLGNLGPGAGDQVLMEVATRLTSGVRDSDIVARLESDEFALLLEANRDLRPVLERLLEHVASPCWIQGQSVHLACSAGCAIFPTDGLGIEMILSSASAALKRAKEKGGGNVQFFNPGMRKQAEEKRQFEEGLRSALADSGLGVHFQPQVELPSGRIAGVEALLRWEHSERGPVPPSLFIPVAEETGLIQPLGAWVLRQACRQAKAWLDAGFPPVTMAVNLSAKQLSEPGFEHLVAQVLEETGLPPEFLELELTESASLEDPDQTVAFMGRVKEMGVRLSLDDFGTGFSNMHSLKRFPVDRLKLDGSFVEKITSDPGSLTISDAIISMAHRLGLQVVAERVETEGQLALLANCGCDQIQGYFFSRPVPAEACSELVRQGRFPVPTRDGPRSRPPAVLILDDEPAVTEGLRRLLTRAPEFRGFHCLTASRAEEAFELLAIHPVDAILCDLRMPGMDGVEFLSRARRMHPHAQRIIFSGHRDFEAAASAINRGAIHKFLTKPVDFRELKEILSEAFQSAARRA